MKLLEDLTIVDFSSRLPGPLATFVLSDLGANIIKIESSSRQDPFNEDDLHAIAPAFKDWYQQINKNKKIQIFDFKEDKDKILKIVSAADAIIAPSNKFFDHFLSQAEYKVLIKIAGGKNQVNLHDLNALALTKTFKLHTDKTPPYLPFAGINLALILANNISAGIIKYFKTQQKIEKKVYLSESTDLVFDALYSESFKTRTKQLHNGGLPSYNIYESKDKQRFCLAAVESKFWDRFIELFEFELNSEHRYDNSGKSFEIIQNKFATLDSNEIQSIIKHDDICLTQIK